jgi:hypothetical protein
LKLTTKGMYKTNLRVDFQFRESEKLPLEKTQWLNRFWWCSFYPLVGILIIYIEIIRRENSSRWIEARRIGIDSHISERREGFRRKQAQ